MENRIPRWLQHCYKMCCEKGGLVLFEDDITAGIYFLDEWTWHMTYIDIRIGLFIASTDHVSII